MQNHRKVMQPGKRGQRLKPREDEDIVIFQADTRNATVQLLTTYNNKIKTTRPRNIQDTGY